MGEALRMDENKNKMKSGKFVFDFGPTLKIQKRIKILNKKIK